MLTVVVVVAMASLPRAADAEDWHPWQGDTVAVQALGGVAGAGVGALAGGLLAAAIVRQNPSDGFGDAVGVALGFVAGGALGTGAGVWGVGEWLGGDGGLSWTLLGGTVGTITGFVVGGSLSAESGSIWVPLSTGLLFGVGGAVIGYHLSASEPVPVPTAALLRLDTHAGMHLGLPIPQPRFDLDGRGNGWQLSVLAGRF